MEEFLKGLKIGTIEEVIEGNSIKFKPHTKFKGVYMMDLVTGNMTEGRLSCHLVKIDCNTILENHIHENNLEIHQVISGKGSCIIGDNLINYTSGAIGIIPQNIRHEVVAGNEGLYILANFIPALY